MIAARLDQLEHHGQRALFTGTINTSSYVKFPRSSQQIRSAGTPVACRYPKTTHSRNRIRFWRDMKVTRKIMCLAWRSTRLN